MIHLLILLVVWPLLAVGQPFDPSWAHAFGGDGDEYIESLVPFGAGYAMGGMTSSAGDETDFYLAVINATGEFQWSRHYDVGDFDAATGLAATSDGGFLLCGYSLNVVEFATDLVLVKTTSNGDTTWTLHHHAADTNFVAYDCGERAGGYWAVGEAETVNNSIGVIWLFSASGEIVGQSSFTDGQFSNFTCGLRTGPGDFVVAGTVRDSLGAETEVWILKLAEGAGAYWSRRIAHPGNDFVLSVTQTYDGSFVFAGLSDGDEPAGNQFGGRVSAFGDILWTAGYGEEGHEEHGHAVTERSNGHLLFVGHGHSHDQDNTDFHFVDTNPDGQGPVQQTFDYGENEVGTAILAVPDAGFIIAGYTFGDTEDSQGLIARFDPSTAAPDPAVLAPVRITLRGNFPNPFNASTSIQFELSRISPVTLTVRDIFGRATAILVDELLPAGTYTVPYSGEHASSGVYFLELQAGNVRQVSKMIVLK